jgi:predicted amidohydrolase
MPLEDVVERATAAPARFLGLWDHGYGRIETGQSARLSVFGWLGQDDELPDAAGNSMSMRRLEPRWTILGGDVIEPVPWRGAYPSSN